MASLLTAPYSQFFDNNGVPLNGGKVYTYAAGTTTPQDSYTDSTGSTPAANPVVLDSAGRAAIWLSGTYKIVVKDSLLNTIYTTDNITPAGSSASSTFTDSTFLIVDNGDATKKMAFETSSITTGTTRTAIMPDKNGTLAMTSDISGDVACFQTTDTTDITLSAAPTQSNIGATKSIDIPTKGVICLEFTGETISSGGASGVVLGIRIGSTNYWPLSTFNAGASTSYNNSTFDTATGTTVISGFGGSVTSNSLGGGFRAGLPIEQLGIPTGTQTVQVIAGKSNANTTTIKGTVVTSRIYISVYDHT